MIDHYLNPYRNNLTETFTTNFYIQHPILILHALVYLILFRHVKIKCLKMIKIMIAGNINAIYKMSLML